MEIAVREYAPFRREEIYALYDSLATDNTEEHAAFYRSVGFAPLAELGCAAFTRMPPESEAHHGPYELS